MKKIVVCGSFGYGNIGDEAVPYAIKDIGESIGVKLDVIPVGRYDLTPISDVIDLGPQDKLKRANLKGLPLLVVGGGIIEEKESGTLYKCKNLFSHKFSSISRVYAGSVEPGVTYSLPMKIKLWWVLRKQPTIFVRDVISEKVLTALFPRKSIEVVGDSVLALKSDVALLPPHLDLPENYFAVCLAPRWDNVEWVAWISKELISIAIEHNTSLVFCPMSTCGDDDRIQHQIITNKIRQLNSKVDVLEINDLLHPRALSAFFQMAGCVISMRLHGCVMSYSQKTPFVGISYHHKVHGFARTVDCAENVIPKILPIKQSNDTYGFNFNDIKLDTYSLLDTVNLAISSTDFTKIDQFKVKLGSRLKEILANE
jgi:polysaccharide pyruvyl transferase WcaK-like protein